MLVVLLSWKKFCQRICHIQIRVYLANLYVAILDILPYHMETLEYMLGSRVRPWFLRVSNGASVVAIEVHRVLRTWKHSDLDDELS